MSARDRLIQAMSDAGLDNVQDDDADFVIEALTSAGWRLVGPDEVDPVTVERCADVARQYITDVGFPRPYAIKVAAEVRALASGANK